MAKESKRHEETSVRDAPEVDTAVHAAKVEPESAIPAVTAASAVALADDDYSDYAGEGLEGVDSREILVPFFRPLSANSKMCQEGSPTYDPDAKAGQIVCTATGERFDGKHGIGFVPVRRQHTFNEWVPYDAGGGFVGVWEDTDPRVPALQKEQGMFGSLKLESKNELVETFCLYGLIVRLTETGELDPDGEVTQGVISFTSTGIKSYKMIIGRMLGLAGTPPKIPLFAYAWRFRTVPQSNKKGRWHGWVATLIGGGPTTAKLLRSHALFMQAKSFSDLLKAGAARADFENSADDGSASHEDTGDAGVASGDDGEHIPF
jgi:hypothetical protein